MTDKKLLLKRAHKLLDRAEKLLKESYIQHCRKEYLLAMMNNKSKPEAACFDCGIPYGEETWVEAIIPDKIWNDIRPDGSAENCGLLCISCMTGRLTRSGYIGVPVWLCGTEPLVAMPGDPAQNLDILRNYSKSDQKLRVH